MHPAFPPKLYLLNNSQFSGMTVQDPQISPAPIPTNLKFRCHQKTNTLCLKQFCRVLSEKFNFWNFPLELPSIKPIKIHYNEKLTLSNSTPNPLVVFHMTKDHLVFKWNFIFCHNGFMKAMSSIEAICTFWAILLHNKRVVSWTHESKK